MNSERKWTLPEHRNKLTRKQIVALFMAQDGKCILCNQALQVKGHMPIEFIDEHIQPLWRLGSNELQNRGLACKPCAGEKTAVEAGERAKGLNVRDKHIGARKPKGRPMLGSKASRWKRTMSGECVRRNPEAE
jgi:hypothetical protein